MRTLVAFLFFSAVWLLFSGIYKLLMIIFGVVSVVLVLIAVGRMNLLKNSESAVILRPFKLINYFFWLFVEIVKSNIAVCKILWSPNISVDQKIIKIPFSQRGEISQVIFANSITLTPGTVTLEMEGKELIVHILNYGEGTTSSLSEMNKRVTCIERG
jgi:multicomponent Na+:H+ antiporter subunit E